jgi:alkylation response protein AidB-like acyl-CoA dehydrogenase
LKKEHPDLQQAEKKIKLGMRASETACLFFEDCRVPEENVLGEIGEGFIQSMKVLDGGRISIAALSLGIAQGALDAALAYSQEREQFGQQIAKFQAISFKTGRYGYKSAWCGIDDPPCRHPKR